MSVLTVVLLVAALAAAAAMVVWRERARAAAREAGAFAGEVQAEVKKVTWPDQKQLKNSTLVILAFVALMALVIGLMDIVLQWVFVQVLPRFFG